MKSDHRFESNNCIWNRFHDLFIYRKNKELKFQTETSNDKNKYKKSRVIFEIQKSIPR